MSFFRKCWCGCAASALLLASVTLADSLSLRRRPLEVDDDSATTTCAVLEGCYLWNNTNRTQVKLRLVGDDNGADPAAGDDTNSYCPGSSPQGWSVRCDADYPVSYDHLGHEIKAFLTEVVFHYDGKHVHEYSRPYFMGGELNRAMPGQYASINDVMYLHLPGDKEFTVSGRQGSSSCFEGAFQLTDSCPVVMTERQKSVSTTAHTTVVTETGSSSVTIVKAVMPAAATTYEEEPCGELAACYLWDKQTGTEVRLTGKDDSYCAKDSTQGWSVRCDTNLVGAEQENDVVDDTANDKTDRALVDTITFSYDGTVFGESGETGWMNGSSTAPDTPDGFTPEINVVPYLATLGDKEFTVASTRAPRTCSELRFTLTDSCPVPSLSTNLSITEGIGSLETHRVEPDPNAATPPTILFCKKIQQDLFYYPSVEAGTIVQARSPVDHTTFDYVSAGGDTITFHRTSRDFWFFQEFYHQNFDLRFVVNDVAGPWTTCSTNSPIGIDVDQSHNVERIVGDFYVDIAGDGTVQHLHEWFAPTEGILLNMMPFVEDGKVTGENLFGDMGRTFRDGYEKLALLDRNADHVISGEELDGLAVWVDANSNARLDDGELNSLESYGIVGLRTDTTTNGGMVSSAIREDGSEFLTEDLWFAR